MNNGTKRLRSADDIIESDERPYVVIPGRLERKVSAVIWLDPEPPRVDRSRIRDSVTLKIDRRIRRRRIRDDVLDVLLCIGIVACMTIVATACAHWLGLGTR
jgi:hypothetical protein